LSEYLTLILYEDVKDEMIVELKQYLGEVTVLAV